MRGKQMSEEVVEEQNTEEVSEENNPTETEELTVEQLKAELEKKEKALKKANAERTRLGKKIKEAPAENNDQPVLTEAAKKAFVVSALKLKGLDDSQAKKFARLVDTSNIELDDDGDVVGIDLDEIEEDFPQLFNIETAPVKKNGGRKPTTGDKSSSAIPPSGQSDVTKQMLKMAKYN
jgi:hypothetical protein